MKFLIYAALGSVVARAFADGFRAAGHVAHFRSLSDHTKGETELCDAVIVDGQHDNGAQVIADFEKRAIRAIAATERGYGRWTLSEISGGDAIPSLVNHVVHGEPMETPKEADSDDSEPQQPSANLSIYDLRARLTELKIEFPANAKKAELAALLARAMNTEA